MTRAFAKAGVPNSLHVVNDGREAIQYLSGEGPYGDRALHPLPQLVLLDLKLRQVSGFDVLRWIRRHAAFTGLMVVVLTSSDHASDIRDSYALGANSFLSKPADPENLTELVQDVVKYWLKKNVVPGAGDGGAEPAHQPPG